MDVKPNVSFLPVLDKVNVSQILSQQCTPFVCLNLGQSVTDRILLILDQDCTSGSFYPVTSNGTSQRFVNYFYTCISMTLMYILGTEYQTKQECDAHRLSRYGN